MKPSTPAPDDDVPVLRPESGLGNDKDSLSGATKTPSRISPSPRDSGRKIDKVLLETQPLGQDLESANKWDSAADQNLEVTEPDVAVIRLGEATYPQEKTLSPATFLKNTADITLSDGEAPRIPTKRADHISILWILGAFLILILLIAGFIVALPYINAPNAARVNEQHVTLNVETIAKIDGLDATNLLLRNQDQAVKIYTNYLRASNPDDVLPNLRDGQQHRDLLIKNWHSVNASNKNSPPRDLSWSTVNVSGKIIGYLTGTRPDHAPINAFFVVDGQRILLDWKATTVYSTASIAQLTDGEGDPTEIRGKISLATFYPTAWPESDYQSYRLIPAAGEDFLWCYARRGGPAESAIAPFFRSSTIIDQGQVPKSVKITLRLTRGLEGSRKNQWLISEMLHIHWIAP